MGILSHKKNLVRLGGDLAHAVGQYRLNKKKKKTPVANFMENIYFLNMQDLCTQHL